MTIDLEPRTRPPSEFDIEQEVDFGRYFNAILARWWLPVAGVVLGFAIGIVVATASRSQPYQATAIVYLGQPYANGNAIQSLPTKLGFVSQLVSSKATLATVGAKTGVKPGTLASRVSAQSVPGVTTGRLQQPTPIVAIKADRLPAAKADEVANALAAVVVKQFSGYVDQKLSTYQTRIARTNSELAKVNAALANAQAQQQALISNHTLPETEKLLLLANINNVVEFNTTRQANLESTQLSLGDQIALAQQVEKARVLEPAAAHRASPPSRRTSAIVGAVIGLIIGLFAALLWDPVALRLRNRPRAT